MAAAVAATFSPLGRALVQQGKLIQGDATAIQADAKRAGVTFIEQLVASKKISSKDVALFAEIACLWRPRIHRMIRFFQN